MAPQIIMATRNPREVRAAMLDPTWVATNNPHAAPAIARPERSRTWAAFLTRSCIVVTPRALKLGHYFAARKSLGRAGRPSATAVGKRHFPHPRPLYGFALDDDANAFFTTAENLA